MANIDPKRQKRLEKARKRRLKRREHLADWCGRTPTDHPTTRSMDGLPRAEGFDRGAFVKQRRPVEVFKPVNKGSVGFDRLAWGRIADGTTAEREPPELDN